MSDPADMTDLTALSVDFKNALSVASLIELAGPASYDRGLSYANSSHFRSFNFMGDSISAEVIGTYTYRVRIAFRDDELHSFCSCPVGQSGAFCKHCVAVALFATQSGDASDDARSDAFDNTSDDAIESSSSQTIDCTGLSAAASNQRALDVRSHLESLSRDELIAMIIEAAAFDDRLSIKLHLAVESQTDVLDVDVNAMKQAIDNAFYADDYVSYYDAYDFSQGINDVIDEITRVLRNANTEKALKIVELAEYMNDRLEGALQYVDDSDGGLSENADNVASLHYDACLIAMLDSADLANRLFALEMQSETFDTFHDSARTYKPLLGKNGLARFRSLAEKEWANIPALSKEDKCDYERFRITNIMEAVMELTGDVDDVVSVMAKNPTLPYQYVRIVERYQDAQRFDDAMKWAAQGISEFGVVDDDRLTEIAAEELHRVGKSDVAVEYMWKLFCHQTSLGSYQRLCDHATRAGTWKTSREKALKYMRSKFANSTKRAAKPAKRAAKPANSTQLTNDVNSVGNVGSASVLIEILLWEDEVELAWREANARGCAQHMWMKLAKARESQYPEEVIPIYEKQIESEIQQKNNYAYSEAVSLIKHVETLYVAAGRSKDFFAYVEQVRVQHKPKRNLMKFFAGQGWSA